MILNPILLLYKYPNIVIVRVEFGHLSVCGSADFLPPPHKIVKPSAIIKLFDIIMKAKIIVTLYIKNVTGALYTVNCNESTLSVSVNAAWNSVILTARRNDCSEVAALT